VKWSRLMSAAAFGLLVAGCGGGSGPKYVKVSGTVTLDGKPLADAIVQFAPKGSKDNQNPGKTSSGYTDANGHYVLKIANEDKEGALVGTHVVRINMKGQEMEGDPKTGSRDDVGPLKKLTNPIPKEWNDDSKQEFTVPADGTDKADFHIVTKKK
jgi:hypothetical protein